MKGCPTNVSYQVADAHHLPFQDGEFDIVTLHTFISHAEDPPQALREARRVVRPGGTIAIFDGDYASLTFAYPDHGLAKTIEEELIQLIVANPRVMRDLPRMLREAGLELVETEAGFTPTLAPAASGSTPHSHTARYLRALGRSKRQSSTTGELSRPHRSNKTPSSRHPTTTPI